MTSNNSIYAVFTSPSRTRLGGGKSAKTMRVLLAFDEEYRAYIEAIANAIRTFHSYVEAAVTNVGELDAEVERFDPQLVIVSGASIPKNPVAEQLIAYIELSPDPDRRSNIQVGKRHWESTNPTLGEILSVVGETTRLYWASPEREPLTDTDEAEDS